MNSKKISLIVLSAITVSLLALAVMPASAETVVITADDLTVTIVESHTGDCKKGFVYTYDVTFSGDAVKDPATLDHLHFQITEALGITAATKPANWEVKNQDKTRVEFESSDGTALHRVFTIKSTVAPGTVHTMAWIKYKDGTLVGIGVGKPITGPKTPCPAIIPAITPIGIAILSGVLGGLAILTIRRKE